jgi:hypothetical protein
MATRQQGNSREGTPNALSPRLSRTRATPASSGRSRARQRVTGSFVSMVATMLFRVLYVPLSTAPRRRLSTRPRIHAATATGGA